MDEVDEYGRDRLRQFTHAVWPGFEVFLAGWAHYRWSQVEAERQANLVASLSPDQRAKIAARRANR